jgi:hypothetical protein
MEFLDFIWLKTKCQREKDKEMLLKVRKFQNENMKLSHGPKYEWQDLKNLLVVFRAEIFFVHILGNATTSYFYSEISWPLPSLFFFAFDHEIWDHDNCPHFNSYISNTQHPPNILVLILNQLLMVKFMKFRNYLKLVTHVPT